MKNKIIFIVSTQCTGKTTFCRNTQAVDLDIFNRSAKILSTADLNLLICTYITEKIEKGRSVFCLPYSYFSSTYDCLSTKFNCKFIFALPSKTDSFVGRTKVFLRRHMMDFGVIIPRFKESFIQQTRDCLAKKTQLETIGEVIELDDSEFLSDYFTEEVIAKLLSEINSI